MSKKTKYIDAKRRGFMQGSVVAGATTAAVATGAVNASDLTDETPAAPSNTEGHAGYKLTDKVRRYYQRARF